MIPPKLLAILRCPESRQPLRGADQALLEQCNRSIKLGTLRNIRGELLKQPLQGGLVREDRKVIYPVLASVSELLVGDGIPLPPLEKTA